MMWSKLKSRIEAGFAECASGRVEVWITRYRAAHDEAGEGWITVDGKRIHGTGTMGFYRAQSALLAAPATPAEPAPDMTSAEVEAELAAEGIMHLPAFTSALFDYLNLSIEDVLSSEQMIIRALGMFDRRLGKRRLLALDPRRDHRLVAECHRMRCSWEGPGPIAGK